jgi:lysozyme
MNRYLTGRILWLAFPLTIGACAPPSSQNDESTADQSDAISVCAAGATVKGIDTSAWQASIDWAKVKASGQDFAIVRVSDGASYEDTRFPTDWPAVKAAGLVRGVYQFFRPAQDPVKQADLLIAKLNQYGPLGDGDLPAILDVETVDGVAAATLRARMQTWLDRVQNATGKKPMIYTAAFMSSTIGTGFSGYPLWVANYGVNCPTMPSGWTGWSIWQSGDHGVVPGVSGNVDVNVFNGTLSDLLAFAGGSGTSGGGSTTSTISWSCNNSAYNGKQYWTCSNGNLYECQNGVPVMTACPLGCKTQPLGQDDVCVTPSPICQGSQAGAYCGNDMMSGADANTLYQCPGANKAPTSSQVCPNGCVVAPAGSPDYCKPASGGGTPGTYKLPWHAGTPMNLSQDCNDSCCNDHVGNDAYAWDFYDYQFFDVVAARGGTVTHVKINSTSGCGSISCENDANYLVIDHGDGTQSTYLHLKGFTLDPAVTCGATVAQGQRLATAGSTGWSTGTHLHFQVSKVHAGAPTCECGANGQGCAANAVPWANFWPNATYPTVPISFVEWPAASQCANRRITLPASQN